MTGRSMLDLARWYDPIFDGVLGGLRASAARIAPTSSEMKVLDIGCGTGRQLAYYRNKGVELYGIDLSLPMLQVAKSNLERHAGLTNGDALDLPFGGDTFDLVISSLFLHQLNPLLISNIVDEIMRVLKPAGRIVLIDFHPGENHSLLGNLTYLAISIIEFMAGREHYQNSRSFLARGGVPDLAAEREITVRKTIIHGYGNLGVYLLA